MKVLITVPWNERLGGAERMLWSFLQNIDLHRVEVHVVFFEAGPFEREVAALPGARTTVVSTGRLRQPHRSAHAILELATLMRRFEPDVILNWAATAQIYGAAAARLAGMHGRVVWWQHAIPSGHRIERAATLLPAIAVGCSSTVAATAQEQVWPRRRVFVVNPGAADEIVARVSQEELDIPAGRIVVGIVGRLQPWKGQHRFVHAVAQLRDRGHDVHALIVGGDAHGLSPEYPPALSGLIARLSLTDRVAMVGHVEDPRPYIRAMDVLVNVSDAEPFGIVVIEGMSQQVPVIAVGDGGARDIIEDGATGLLIDRPDAALLADALERIITQPALRERLGSAGRAQFLKHFTATAMAAKLESSLRQLSAQHALSA